MIEKDLGKALLNLSAMELAGMSDLQVQTARVLERDRFRVRMLSGMTIAVWLFAGFLILAALVAYGFTFPKQAQLRDLIAAGAVTPAQRDELQIQILMAFMKGTLFVGFSVAMMTLAALSTVVLILASRRATLRQVNAGLLQVAEHLKQLRQGPGGKPALG